MNRKNCRAFGRFRHIFVKTPSPTKTRPSILRGCKNKKIFYIVKIWIISFAKALPNKSFSKAIFFSTKIRRNNAESDTLTNTWLFCYDWEWEKKSNLNTHVINRTGIYFIEMIELNDFGTISISNQLKW